MRKIETYKIRIILTTTLLFIVMIIAWQAAIKPTMELWQDNNQIEEQLQLLNQAPMQIAQLSQQIEIIDEIIGDNSGILGQEDIVNSISEYLRNNDAIKLCSFPPVHNAENENYQINTFEIELQGTFHQLVKFLNYFEKDRKIGKLSSVSFYMSRNKVTKQNELYQKIYLQSFRKK